MNWYLARDDEVSKRFAYAVDDAMNRILDNPDRFPLVCGNFRGCRITKFPYQIIYRFGKDFLRIQAVAHLSRRLGYWKKRR
ncbi:hypothetical protein HG15A2_44820 [Adhaeretor mobilis]|uniref:Plasmid stabilization system n=2 Tax=Adhaeretor mobilis TaxID=1930276 RepID=A0A517N1Y1_9BACT|nr:hypothetical protein HG15A2_44820 [Adhaeretor mobilis]